MISTATLEHAVERGILTQAQAAELMALETRVPPPPAPAVAAYGEDEALRLVSGFGDIFVTIGIVLFLGALTFLVAQGSGWTSAAVAVAVATWGLTEYFTRRRRMALPSIVLLATFAAACFLAVEFLLAGRATGLDTDAAWPSVGAGVATAVASALHYWRFRVPITVAAGVAALCVVIVAGARAAIPGPLPHLASPLVLACGLGCFALAMRFDLSDPDRETRRADIAFWLHLLAAPMIVHPLIRVVFHNGRTLGAGDACLVLALFAALGLLAVVIDRRALLVSGLLYAGFASGALIHSAGLANDTIVVPLVLLILGGFVLLLSAGWQPLRAALLRHVPPRLALRLPHPPAGVS